MTSPPRFLRRFCCIAIICIAIVSVNTLSMTPIVRRSLKLKRSLALSDSITQLKRRNVKQRKVKRLISSREAYHRKGGYELIIGVDEAGRGPLAGPVVAAACCFLNANGDAVDGLDDSKVLTEKTRDRLFEQLTNDPDVAWSTCVVSSERIDEINILQATMEAMQKSIEDLLRKAPFERRAIAIIDGNRSPEIRHIPCEHIVRGDSKERCIAAASVIAKVTRDRLMVAHHQKYPSYGFDRHKGYGTKAHLKAIERYGPCDIHRMTFRPLNGSS